MTGEQGFVLHPLAAQDITEIWEYIAADSPLAARRVREEIQIAIRALVLFPGKGHKRPELAAHPLRFIHVRDYLIAYVPEKPISILAVIHGRRNPRLLAAILRSRE